MRVLSIQQPWAHLVIRGVKQVEIRSWPSPHKERIAIHASTNTALNEARRAWESSSAVARCFAEQGWLDRDDLKALPRTAILGTVDLLGVHRAAAVRAAQIDFSGKDWLTDALEHAVRDPATGHLRPAQAPVRTMPVVIPDEGYVCAFARALEIEPITDVPGQQHLWTLPGDLAAVLAEREAQSRRGEWSPGAPSRERRRASIAAWRERWETDLEREAWRLQREAVIEMQNETMAFEEELLEKRFRRTLKSYLAEHGEPGPDGKPHVRILRRLRALFGDREFVPAAEFELELRRLLHQAAEDDETRREGMDRHKQIVALLTELRAQAEQKPLDEAAIERDVKLAFRRLFLAQMKRLEATERWVDIEED